MREIEFRGKDIISGELVKGDLIHGVGDKCGKVFILPIRVNLAYVKNCDPLDGVEVNPESVGQFTGLLDKNGKKIFEWDVVKFNNHNWKEEVYIATVVWGKKSHGYSLKVDTKLYNKWGRIKYYSLPCSKNIEIIGNVTENPELLK